jgi:hypothetical protein
MRRLLLILPLVLGCSSGGAATSSVPRDDRDVITREELAQNTATDAYSLVQRVRPDFLRPQRGPTTINGAEQTVVLYVDGVRRGGPEILRTLRPEDLAEIRFITGRDATTRWGTDHGAGVIAITTRR